MMKIPAFLLPSAQESNFRAAFNWSAEAPALRRIEYYGEDDAADRIREWAERVKAHHCEAVLWWTAEQQGIEILMGEIEGITDICLDDLAECDRHFAEVNLGIPENLVVVRWNLLAAGAAIPFPASPTSASVWLAYSRAAETWQAGPQVPRFARFDPVSQFPTLTRSDFHGAHPGQACDSLGYYPCRYCPAFGIRVSGDSEQLQLPVPSLSPLRLEQARSVLMQIGNGDAPADFLASARTTLNTIKTWTRIVAHQCARETQFSIRPIIGSRVGVALADRSKTSVEILIAERFAEIPKLSKEILQSWKDAVLILEQRERDRRVLLTLEREPPDQGLVIAIGSSLIVELGGKTTYRSVHPIPELFVDGHVGLAPYSLELL